MREIISFVRAHVYAFFHPRFTDKIDLWKPIDSLPLDGCVGCLDCRRITLANGGCRVCGSHSVMPVGIVGAEAYKKLLH